MPRKLLKFIILFDNTSLLYFPGQFLSGRVLLELQDDTPALGLHFHVVGEGVVRVRSARQERTYDRENFIDFRMRLLGGNNALVSNNGGDNGGGGGGDADYESRTSHSQKAASSHPHHQPHHSNQSHHSNHSQQQQSQHRQHRQQSHFDANGNAPLPPQSSAGSAAAATVLSPGIHSFPFKLGLPLGLPSTFLGRYGWIQYYCKAALREPSGLIHKNHQVFIVMNPIDLNLEQSALAQPFKCDVEHRLGVSCVGGGLVRCRVALDRGGYVPGESISITAHVHNGSNVTLRGTKAALTETIQYLARGRQVQQERRQLAVIARGKIRPGGRDEWQNEQLYVPPLPPTNLRGCHLIKIQYDVFFIIEPKSIEKPIKLQLPIVLATYPFRNTLGPSAQVTAALDNGSDATHAWPESILKPDTHYPSTLPIFRPWLHDKPDTS